MLEEVLTIGATVVAVASAITAALPTPPRPAEGDSWGKRVWWALYQLIELLALVNRQVKARPNAATAIIAAAEKGDIATVIDRAKLLVR